MLEALALGPSSKRVAVIGGSKSTLYARFGGKDGLLASAVTHHCADVDVAIDVQARGDTAAQLMQIGRSFLKAVLDPRTLDVYRAISFIALTVAAMSGRSWRVRKSSLP
jgi:AcrR family transcriptional regulator